MAVWGSNIENGVAASVAGGATIDVVCASGADVPATVAENAPAANWSSSRRDGSFEWELLNLFCIASALWRSPLIKLQS